MIELRYNQLKRKCGKKQVAVKDAPVCLIGQDGAAEALKLGLSMRDKGFNVYVSGPRGSGRTTFAAAYAKELAGTRSAPPDLCYVYNFAEPRYPRLLALPSGMGRTFCQDMEEFSEEVAEELIREFGGRDFEAKKHGIVKVYQEERDKIIREITEEARAKDYGVKMNGSGIYFMPIVDGEMISEDQYNAMPQDEKDSIAERTEFIQEKAQEAMRGLREQERSTQKEVGELEQAAATDILTGLLAPLIEKYGHIEDDKNRERLLEFFEMIKKDVLENLADFAAPENDDEEYLQSILPWMTRREKSDTTSKYLVNLLSESLSENKNAPVIVDYNPTYANLVGEVEYDSEFGNLTTDFMKIKPGLLHKANGGFLILQAKDLLKNNQVWETLCKCLITRKVAIEPNREYTTGITVAPLRPEPCDIDVKVVLIGPSFFYHLLSEYDEDFCKLFKINAVFDFEMAYSGENIKRVAAFAKAFAAKRSAPPPDSEALQLLIEHLSRLAERQDKLCTQLGLLEDVMTEAAAYAGDEGAINAAHVAMALAAKEKRAGLMEEKINDMIEQNIIMIDTEGSKTAQINGLAVLEAGEHVFAKPTRITATTYVGKAGIVNIEKEADLSGQIHDKGIQVITGYLGQKYAQDFPLALSCRVCFEQNYAGVDGDSASGAELLTILSSLADVPLRQDLAITGSINQRGEIQAIGGVTYKVEGFFALCKQRGLTGKQGVIIPMVNIVDLTLRDEVVQAVREGKFHIYAIDHIDEAINLMTNQEAGILTDGKYPKSTIHGLVYRKLRKFYRRSAGD